TDSDHNGIGDVCQLLPPNVLAVRADAQGMKDGRTWTTAFNNPQSALFLASRGKEIWVAKGTYTASLSGDRTATFQLKNGVALYGGFTGNELQLSQRAISANQTVLTGDLGGN